MKTVTLGFLIRKIELWNTGVSKKTLSEYLELSEYDLRELLKLIGAKNESIR